MLVLNGHLTFLFIALSLFNFFIVHAKAYSKAFFHFALLTNITFLFFYKYLKVFLSENSPLQSYFIIPIGISFFVFQQLSYLIDAHRKPDSKVKHLGHYLTFAFFFGNFISGPIEKASNVIPRLVKIKFPDLKTARTAWLLIYWGLFKKIAVADNMAPIVLKLFAPDKNIFNSKDVLPAFLFNKYEIYANFSGYTDIAIGVGILFGLNFTQNFKRPFASLSIKEFWKRWHLSLSYWIRDYIFFPLSTSRISKLGLYPILAITFTIFAIWHDLRITFIIYGLLQVLLIFLSSNIGIFVESFHKKLNNRVLYELVAVLRKLWVYIILISFPSIFFRVINLKQANAIFHSIFSLKSNDYFIFFNSLLSTYFLIVFLIIFTEFIEFFREKFDLSNWLEKKSYWLEVVFHFCALLLFISFAKFNNSTSFIYSHY
ncbi:MAG: MBOAT family protein [Bacteriovorax sp.]|nr:MBOAT family protein [Bacteriovorax sp.]